MQLLVYLVFVFDVRLCACVIIWLENVDGQNHLFFQHGFVHAFKCSDGFVHLHFSLRDINMTL